MATSCASSCSQSMPPPKELLLVLKILNEKLKRKHEQQHEHKQEQDMQQQQKHQHIHYHSQYNDQQQHKQQELNEEGKWEVGEQKQSHQHMELSQIELIYLAEGNTNLVLALPQFKKVLRLPKISKWHEQQQLEHKAHKAQCQETQSYQKDFQQYKQPHGPQKQHDEMNQQEPNNIIPTTGQQEKENDAVGILTMDHYVAYIGIIRCLVGNGFVFEADVVAVPNPTDRHWINEHIKPYRPGNRLDKEFGGHFGLLLPDATQLPAEFDTLFSNFQSETVTTATNTSHCSKSSSCSDKSCSRSNNIFGSDTFAIEIKPKQGWLLPNDVNNLFDMKPKITQTTRITQPPSLRETKNALNAAVATAITTGTETKALKTSTDIVCFTTTTQSEPSPAVVSAVTTTTTATTTATATTTTTTTTSKIKPATIRVPTKRIATMTSTISETEAPTTTSRCCSNRINTTSITPRDDNISHSLYDKVDTRCRYCCMQFLKLKQQKIIKRSQYCPIDLFSGINEKMQFALQALFECPQNNLRIFQNGNLIFDDKKSKNIKIEDLFSSDKLQLIKHLLVTCLLREYESKGDAESEEKEQIGKDSRQQLLSAAMEGVSGQRKSINEDAIEAGSGVGVVAGQPLSSVTSWKKQKLSTMPNITTTPTTLTETEVTKVKSTLTSAKPISSEGNSLMSTFDYSTQCLEQLNKTEVTCLPKNCVLQKILHLQSLAKNNFQFMLDHEYADKREKTYTIVCKLLEKFTKAHNELTLCQLSPEEQYTLAATAMDCSIMITFFEIENTRIEEDKNQKNYESCNSIASPFVISIFGRSFITKVTLLDLDPKPDTHFNKYLLQTKEIVAAMKET